MPVDLRQLLTGAAPGGGRPQERPGTLPVAVLTMELQRGVVVDAVAGVPAEYAAEVLHRSLSLIAILTTVDELIAMLEGGAAQPAPTR